MELAETVYNRRLEWNQAPGKNDRAGSPKKIKGFIWQRTKKKTWKCPDTFIQYKLKANMSKSMEQKLGYQLSAISGNKNPQGKSGWEFIRPIIIIILAIMLYRAHTLSSKSAGSPSPADRNLNHKPIPANGTESAASSYSFAADSDFKKLLAEKDRQILHWRNMGIESEKQKEDLVKIIKKLQSVKWIFWVYTLRRQRQKENTE